MHFKKFWIFLIENQRKYGCYINVMKFAIEQWRRVYETKLWKLIQPKNHEKYIVAERLIRTLKKNYKHLPVIPKTCILIN